MFLITALDVIVEMVMMFKIHLNQKTLRCGTMRHHAAPYGTMRQHAAEVTEWAIQGCGICGSEGRGLVERDLKKTCFIVIV